MLPLGDNLPIAETDAMTIAVPDWIKTRNGDLKPSKDGHSWTVWFAGQPQYLLEPLPAKGKFACRILQTNNGKRLDKDGVWDSKEAALQGGLTGLREVLGW